MARKLKELAAMNICSTRAGKRSKPSGASRTPTMAEAPSTKAMGTPT
jgi:hypothetical protein